jgi:Ca-activated chloride channel family protein
VNAKKTLKIVLIALFSLILADAAFADSAKELMNDGNKFYSQSNFNEAIKKYDQALIERPQALEPKYNKANSYYRLDDLSEAIDLYQKVAAGSKDMRLVAKSKYNLGNCYFQRGSKQKDSDLQKALEDLKSSIDYWRQVLDIEPENEKAAKNIEVARLTIKDIIDQLNKQKQQQEKQKGQQEQQQQQGQQREQQDAQGQQQKGLEQEPNKPQEPNQPSEKQQGTKEPQQQQQVNQQKAFAPDATAQQILDKEQHQKKERQVLQRAQYQKVDKDW